MTTAMTGEVLPLLAAILDSANVTYVAVGRRVLPLTECPNNVQVQFVRDRLREVLASPSADDVTETG